MLLSVVIPAYDRPGPLSHALETFASQIAGRFESDVEIIVTDDASPGNSLAPVAELAAKYPFMTFRRREKNLGLEQSLIAAAEGARGEFLWIFGDDDYLEHPDTLAEVMGHLRSGRHDMLVLNRTRRNTDLSTLLTPNWMKLDGDDIEFPGLRQFCLKYGFISVIGFISVNIFRREAFMKVDPSPYYGTMYPQLGMMVEAFHDRPVRLLVRPNVCHRTQTQEEKRAVLGAKASEANFMADAERRNALYFSHPYVHMLDRLATRGAFRGDDVCRIPENTVINGLLIDFLMNCLEKSAGLGDAFTDGQWKRSIAYIGSLPLSDSHRKRLQDMARARFGEPTGDLLMALAANPRAPQPGSEVRTISVVSPSYNQAEFLDECLSSVANQTVPPIEHLVYDPGSKDNSREIARKYKHLSFFPERDDGQSDAINKGYRRARGDVIIWLNSDDVFADPGVFERVIKRFNEPDRPDIVYGKGIYIDERGDKLRDVYINKKPETLPWRLQQEDGILQPALFMRRSVFEKIGEVNGGLHYCMDYEYWIRCIKAGIKFAYVDDNLALARYHSSNKTYGQRGKSYAEVCDMLVSHFGYANHNWLRRYAEFLSEGFDGVLAHAANSNVKNEAEIERHYEALLKAYNTSQSVYALLASKPAEKGYGDTLRELNRLGIGPSTPAKEIPVDQATEPAHACYTVGSKRWAFDAAWKKKQIEKSHAFLRGQIAKRRNDACVIVGNGPSLKKSNLDLLKGQDVIISNNAFLEPKLLECASYYTVVNYLVAEQSSHNINRLSGVPKVLPYWLSYCLNEGDDTFFMDAVGHAAFSKDMFKNMSWRHTVTFYNLHLAFGLGYKRAVMIGFDHFYKQSAEVKEGDIILTKEEDPNHFDSRYFRGKKWQAADVDMMEEMYRLAKAAYDEEGREIVNATVGGALELFPRMDLADALAMRPAPAAKPRPASTRLQATSAPAAVAPSPLSSPIGSLEHPRTARAVVDETNVVAYMLADRRGTGHIMLDVGAHFGGSAAYFDTLGWTIYCCEPDPSNRTKLVAQFGTNPNVTIDVRAVSDKPATGVAFFTSSESTGISGLSAFRETHTETARVDLTTVRDIVATRGFKKVDFLKIDVEGFDFSVLKGVPWEKIQPDVIECEFEDAKTVPMGHTYKDVASYLVEKGYAVYLSEWHPIIRYGIRHDWRRVVRFPGVDLPPDAWGNILAFREDPGLDVVESAFKALIKTSHEKPKEQVVMNAPAQPSLKSNVDLSSRRAAWTERSGADLPQGEGTGVRFVQAPAPAAFTQNVAAASAEPASVRTELVAGVAAAGAALVGGVLLWQNGVTAVEATSAATAGASLAPVGLALLAGLGTVAGVQWVRSRRATAATEARILGLEQSLTERLAHEMSALRAKADGASSAAAGLEGMLSQSKSELASLAARLDTVEKRTVTAESSAGTLKTALAGLTAEQTKQQSAIADVSARLGAVKTDMQSLSQRLDQAGAKSTSDLKSLSASIAELGTKLAPVQQGVELAKQAAAKADAAAASALKQASDPAAIARVLDPTAFQPFNRRLTPEQVKTIETNWLRKLSVPATARSIAYLASRVREIERRCHGRLATTIEDATLRCIVGKAVKGNEINVLEIGTLFGIGAAIVYDAMRGPNRSVHLTLLDPLKGYYDAASLDPLTQLPVDRSMVYANMAAAGVPAEDLTLIEYLSTEPIAIREAAKKSYDLLVIDGDHSLVGVAADFVHYAPMVKVGGYVIFDDYNKPDWPDVQQFVDQEMPKHSWCMRVGAEWTTAVFRVVQRPPALGDGTSVPSTPSA